VPTTRLVPSYVPSDNPTTSNLIKDFSVRRILARMDGRTNEGGLQTVATGPCLPCRVCSHTRATRASLRYTSVRRIRRCLQVAKRRRFAYNLARLLLDLVEEFSTHPHDSELQSIICTRLRRHSQTSRPTCRKFLRYSRWLSAVMPPAHLRRRTMPMACG
jgi:hypothetical protein